MQKETVLLLKGILALLICITLISMGFFFGRYPFPDTPMERLETLESHAQSVLDHKPQLIGQGLENYLNHAEDPSSAVVMLRETKMQIDAFLRTARYDDLKYLELSMDMETVEELEIFMESLGRLIEKQIESIEFEQAAVENDSGHDLLVDLFVVLFDNGFADGKQVLANLHTEKGRGAVQDLTDYVKEYM